ncbi:MAG: sigma-54 dependent transcriptional regulator [Terriglobia bacterium]
MTPQSEDGQHVDKRIYESILTSRAGLSLPRTPRARSDELRPAGCCGLAGNSVEMQRVYDLVEKVAPKRHPVLIYGESGTGKGLVARAIHNLAQWSQGPFITVDCGALTPTLIESELFGQIRGAFTGASATRQGLLAAARGGTVFIDEISELPVELQSKLLHVLQEHEFRVLGSNEYTRLNARVIAATNQDLMVAVKRGAFRQDLYFRLNVLCINLPPLRERRSDIPALVRYFIERQGGAEDGFQGVSEGTMFQLLQYDWPGNVRELENCITRALTLGTPPLIQKKDLPPSLLNAPEPTTEVGPLATLRELERKAIVDAVQVTGGDCLRAAKLLGVGKTTIYRKLKQYRLAGHGLEGEPASGSGRIH